MLSRASAIHSICASLILARAIFRVALTRASFRISFAHIVFRATLARAISCITLARAIFRVTMVFCLPRTFTAIITTAFRTITNLPSPRLFTFTIASCATTHMTLWPFGSSVVLTLKSPIQSILFASPARSAKM